MDGRACGKASACFPSSQDTSAELWHSTPVKKKNARAPPDLSQSSALTSFRMDSTAKQWAERTPPIPGDNPSPRISLGTEFPVNDLSSSTIQRQRRELQLLMAELKDRDRELNSMAASHHKQLHAREQDRQRVLTLEQRCTRLDDELQKRNEVIRVLTKRVWVVETREKEVQKELSAAQQQLRELEQKQQHVSQKCQDFEEKNQSLSSTLMALSSQVGSLQVREEELSSMLKLKDKDVTAASGQILDLTGRLRDLETSLKESRSQETKLLRDMEENKHRYREARLEVTHLKEELQQQVTQSSSQREEIIRLKQELQLLHTDVALTGGGDNWKDELLELARSKQERTMSELRYLRQVCENQRNDLQLLQLNLESVRGTMKEKTSAGLRSRGATVLESVSTEGISREEQPSCSQSSEPRVKEAPDSPRTRKKHGPAEHRKHTPRLSTETTDVTMTLSDLTLNCTTNPNSPNLLKRPRSRGNHSTSSSSYAPSSQSKDSQGAANCGQDQLSDENQSSRSELTSTGTFTSPPQDTRTKQRVEEQIRQKLRDQEELTCNCLENRSPASTRLKSSGPVHDATPAPGPGLGGSVIDDLGVFAPHLRDGEERLSSSALQQLVDEFSSLRPHSSFHNSGPEPLYSHKYQTPPYHHHHHHHPTTPAHTAGKTPPKACPRHCTTQPCGWPHTD